MGCDNCPSLKKKPKQPSNLTNQFELLIITCKYQSHCSCKKKVTGEPWVNFLLYLPNWKQHPGASPLPLPWEDDAVQGPPTSHRHGEDPWGTPGWGARCSPWDRGHPTTAASLLHMLQPCPLPGSPRSISQDPTS